MRRNRVRSDHTGASIARRNCDMRARLLAIPLLFTALTDAPAALAQLSRSHPPAENSAVGSSNDLRRIRCAGAAELCGWKRIPGTQPWRRGHSYRNLRRAR